MDNDPGGAGLCLIVGLDLNLLYRFLVLLPNRSTCTGVLSVLSWMKSLWDTTALFLREFSSCYGF